MNDGEAQAKQKMYNLLFLGEKADALLPFFKNFFDASIEFPRTSGVFYYPFRVSESRMIRAFAAFPASLELIATPREFGDADGIVLVINVQSNDHFGDFVPYFQSILEKKLACPPVAIIGLTIDQDRPRQLSYFGMVALKHFIATTFMQPESHLIEWNVQRKAGGKRGIEATLSDVMTAIDRCRHDTRAVVTRSTVRNEILNLKKEMQAWKFLDKKAGLKCLIVDEDYCMTELNREGTRFLGYNRDLMVRHGLDPAFVKEILDDWESLDGARDVPREELDAARRRFPGVFEPRRKYLAPRSLSNLVVEMGIEVPVAKALLQELRDEAIEVDVHHTQAIVEELSSITELIIIFASQPVFYHLPNEKMGVGSIDNIEMLSGMFHVLDILRNQVYTTTQQAKATVEKIKYGTLNLTIAHGKRAKCIVHSLRPLSDDILKKVQQYIESFEGTFAHNLDRYNGEVNIFTEKGRRLYDDIFTPLSLNQVNTDWRVAALSSDLRNALTQNQARVLETIQAFQAEGTIGQHFHLEDIFSHIAGRARLSLSDLLLLLPGELLSRDSPA